MEATKPLKVVIDPRMWMTGKLGTTDGPKCALGWVNYVCHGDPYWAYDTSNTPDGWILNHAVGHIVEINNAAEKCDRKLIRALNAECIKINAPFRFGLKDIRKRKTCAQ